MCFICSSGSSRIAGENHHQVGLVEGLKPWDVLRRVDETGLGIDGEEHGALTAVPRGQDAAQLRYQLLAAVFVVTRDEHDVLPGERSVFALQHNAGLVGLARSGGRKKEDG